MPLFAPTKTTRIDFHAGYPSYHFVARCTASGRLIDSVMQERRRMGAQACDPGGLMNLRPCNAYHSLSAYRRAPSFCGMTPQFLSPRLLRHRCAFAAQFCIKGRGRKSGLPTFPLGIVQSGKMEQPMNETGRLCTLLRM